MMLKERRAVINSMSINDNIKFKQALVKYKTDTQAAKAEAKIRKNMSSVKSCKDFNKFSKNINSNLSSETI